jgi:single-strand DNA-binding protein
MNVLVLSGNLGADPEVHFTESGTQITTFSMAFKSTQKKTCWIKVACFLKTAEIAEKNLSKGMRVCVIGLLDQDSWEDKKGKKQITFKMIANTIEFNKYGGRESEDDGNDETPF